ncbi:MAG: ATP-binding protein [Nanoarchaeota archaeon]
MDRGLVKRYLLDFQERNLPQVIPRDVSLPASRKIRTVVGARRVGKTYLLYDTMGRLEESGISKKQVLYLNFESPALIGIACREVRDIVELHWSLFPEVIKKKLYVFIDEPQALDSWEIAVRDLQDSFDAHIWITGSSSRLLSRDIATALRGRLVSTMLLPLSFREFLRFKGKEVDGARLSTRARAETAHLLEEYVRFGGYPEIALEGEPTEKLKIIKDYFDLTIYKDIIERYAIKNTSTVKWLMNMLVASIAKEMSVRSLYLLLKSQGVKVSKNTLYEYISILEDAFFVFLVRKFEVSRKKEGLSMPKVYAGDVSFLNLLSQEEYGRRLENIVFLELSRKKNERPLLEIHYWKDVSGKEIDFVLSEGKKITDLIQVCSSMSDDKTRQREIKALLAGLEMAGMKEGVVITKDETGTIEENGMRIRILPLWEWLLR